MSAHHALILTPRTRLMTIAIGAIAILLVVLFGAAIGEWMTTQLPPVSRNPFSVGISEGGAASNGIAAMILNIQARFSEAMTKSLSLIKQGESGLISFIAIGFAYGIFHAAGPGHGKAVIAAYAFSREKAIGRTIAMASAAAALQSFVAIALVTILSLLIRVTAPTMRNATQLIELISFLAISMVGLVLLWQKAAHLAVTLDAKREHAGHMHIHAHDAHSHDHHHGGHTHHHHDHHGHTHAPIAPANADWKDMVSAIVAAGIRPCSGSILILIFALSQNLFTIGILAAIAIGIGTAITTSGLAVFAILAKAAAVRIARHHSDDRAQFVVNALEVLAASFVFVLGLSLIIASLSGAMTNS
jgi:nickel/cobalt exporter